jgi:glucosamine-phosphate N-acetyltransferase
MAAVVIYSLKRLCSPAVHEVLEGHPDLVLRRVTFSDFYKGYFELLSQLTEAPKVSGATFRNRLFTQRCSPTYFVLVVEDRAKSIVVASITLLIEYKFIRGCGKVGHIEDVVVKRSYRRLGLGSILLSRAEALAREQGCYKVILDCSESNTPFYVKSDYEVKGSAMAKYF